MPKSRERQRRNRKLKMELQNLDRLNGSRISDPTAYMAQRKVIIEQFRNGRRGQER